MKQTVILLTITLLLTLGGCSSPDIMAEQFGIQTAEVQSADEFNCVVRYSGADEELTLTGQAAKDLYIKLVTMVTTGEEISSASGDGYLNLCFYDGLSGFFDAPAETASLGDATGEFLHFWDSAVYYGTFTVYDSDRVRITELPTTSHGVAVAPETGAYTELTEWIETQTEGGTS